MASRQSNAAFNARAVAGLFSAERLYRVYFAPGGLFFIRVGGARHDPVAIHFGLIGLLISQMTMKGRMRKVEEKMADMDQRSLRDRLEDHKDNFREPFAQIASSRIDPAGFFTTQGSNCGRWTVKFQGRSKMTFQFDHVDDMRIAVSELPKALSEVHSNYVEWNDRKRKYVKAHS